MSPGAARAVRVLALAWVIAAAGATVALGPRLGLRGWLWLTVHHVLCGFGAGWELWGKARFRRAPGPGPGDG